MTYWRPHPAITAVVHLLAITVPIAIVLAVIGSSPTLLEKVPEEHRGTVAAFGDGAARLSGSDGGIFGFDDAGASNSTVQGLPLPRHGDWSPRRPGTIRPRPAWPPESTTRSRSPRTATSRTGRASTRSPSARSTHLRAAKGT